MAWLDELLPADAADICRDRLKLIVTNIPSFKQTYVSDYSNKQDLIQANMASVGHCFLLLPKPHQDTSKSHDSPACCQMSKALAAELYQEDIRRYLSIGRVHADVLHRLKAEHLQALPCV